MAVPIYRAVAITDCFRYYLRAEQIALSSGRDRLADFQPELHRCGFCRGGRSFCDCGRKNEAGRLVVARRFPHQQGRPPPNPEEMLTRKRARCRHRGRFGMSLLRRDQTCCLSVRPRIDQFALQQIKRRLAVKLEVVEGVGENICHPDQPRRFLHVADEEKLDGRNSRPPTPIA